MQLAGQVGIKCNHPDEWRAVFPQSWINGTAQMGGSVEVLPVATPRTIDVTAAGLPSQTSPETDPKEFLSCWPELFAA